MSDIVEQMASRWISEVMAHATSLVEATVDDVAILDKHLRREVLELGIRGGYTATLELLIREGLLPTTEAGA